MKKVERIIISTILYVFMALSMVGMQTVPVSAATSIKEAKTEYENALKTQKQWKEKWKAAKKAYQDAQNGDTYRKGAFGFYQWIIDTQTGWKSDDAKEALEVLDKCSYKNYTKQGDSKDATNIENMKVAVDLLPVMQDKRKNDNNFPGLQDITVRNVFMARAQVNANASSSTGKHMDSQDTGTSLGKGGGENLAWGYDDPFYGWYDEEKKEYDKERKYVLDKYKIDINTLEAEYWYNNIDYNAYIKEMKNVRGETGHYLNVCAGSVKITTYNQDGTYSFSYRNANHVFCGLAYSGYGNCHALETNISDKYNEGYTLQEFTNLFYTYYNTVAPLSEKAACENTEKQYEKACTKTRKALAALKKAGAMKLKGKRDKKDKKKKTVIIRWKKMKDVNGYQISVSDKRYKDKIVKTFNSKKMTRYTYKSRKKRYVKIRAFVKINGKKVYFNWSKPVRV